MRIVDPMVFFDMNKKYTFTKMTIEDVSFYNCVRNECRSNLHDSCLYSLDDSKEWFLENNPLFFMLNFNSNIIGYFRTSNMNIVDKSIFIGLDIHKDFRGNGHAKNSYDLFMSFLNEIYEIEKFYLRVLKDNERALNLYNKLGFFIIEETDVDFKMEKVYEK